MISVNDYAYSVVPVDYMCSLKINYWFYTIATIFQDIYVYLQYNLA